MRILLIHYRFFISGGPERYLFSVKQALEERGHTVIPFSVKNSKNEESEYEKYFVDNIGKSNEVFIDKYPKTIKACIDLIGRELYSNKVRKALEKLINEENPEICYLLAYKRVLSPSVIYACKEHNIPVINRISDYNTVCGAGSLYRNGSYCELCIKNDVECFIHKCVKGSYLFSLMRYLSIQLHKHIKVTDKVNGYVCTNQYMVKMMERYGYPLLKLHVIPTFFKEDEEINTWDKTNLINPKMINFLFIGNVDESKGIYDLLDSLTKVIKIKANFHLHIVGGLHEEEINRVKSVVEKMNLAEFITCVPFVKTKEVFQYYLKANVTIIPARWVENLPNTLVESTYFQRPVIVPDYGSFKYTVDKSVSFKFRALSSDSLAECLIRLCENPVLIDEKSKNCKEFFKKNFSENAHMQKLVTLFERECGYENI